MTTKFIFYLVTFLLIAIHKNDSANVLLNKVIKMVYFDGYCKGMENLPFGYSNMTIDAEPSRKSVLSGDIIIKKDLGSDIELKVDLKKCRTKDVLDSCTNYKSFVCPFCFLVEAKKQVWSTFFGNVTPHLKCPLKKGNYKMTKAWFDLKYIPFKVDPNDYWIITAKLFNSKTKEHYSCHKAAGYLVPAKMLNQ